MKTKLFVICACVVGVLTGCSVFKESQDLRTTNPSFQPKKNYGVNFNTMWNTVENVLLAEGVEIISSQKQKRTGRIITDYIDGGRFIDCLSRYNYSISIDSTGKNISRILILSNVQGKCGDEEWKDEGKTYKKIVINLEDWLYKKIETALDGNETKIDLKNQPIETTETLVEPEKKSAFENPTIPFSSKETIIEAQKRLNDLGLNAGPTDGIMGKKTAKAIGQFQKIRGLEVTNQLNQETIEALGIK